MEVSIINHLEDFLEDVPFPIDRAGLVQEALDSPLPANMREAIALLPDQEYHSRTEVTHALIDVPFDDGIPKKDLDAVDVDIDDKPDSVVPLGEFTQMGDEDNHEDGEGGRDPVTTA